MLRQEITKQHSQGLLNEAKVLSETSIKKELADLVKRLTTKKESLHHIVISGVLENKFNTLTCMVLTICKNLEPDIVQDNLLSCKRLGAPNENEQKPRLVLGELHLRQDEKYVC